MLATVPGELKVSEKETERWRTATSEEFRAAGFGEKCLDSVGRGRSYLNISELRHTIEGVTPQPDTLGLARYFCLGLLLCGSGVRLRGVSG